MKKVLKLSDKEIAEEIITIQEETPGYRYPKAMVRRILTSFSVKKIHITGSLLVISLVIANMLNFLFNIYLGRKLTFDDFALISLVSSFFYFSRIPSGALSATTNFKSSFMEGKFGENASYRFWAMTRKKAFLISFFLTVIWLMGTPFLMSFFQTTEPAAYILFGLVWLIGLPLAVDRGYMNGKMLFGIIALLTIVEPVIKMGIAVVFAYLGHSHFAYAAIPLALTGTFFVGWMFLLREKPQQLQSIPQTKDPFPWQYFFVSIISGLSNITFLNLDIVLAKHYLSPTAAGQYALISLTGKMIYFSGSLASQFIVPLIGRKEGESKDSTSTFYKILVATVVLTGAGVIFCGFFGFFTIPFIYGPKALAIVPYLLPFSLAMMCFSLSRVFETYYLTKRLYSLTFITFFLALLQFVLFSINHANVDEIVSAMVFIGCSNLILTFALHVFSSRIYIVEKKSAAVVRGYMAKFAGLWKSRHTKKNNRQLDLGGLIILAIINFFRGKIINNKPKNIFLPKKINDYELVHSLEDTSTRKEFLLGLYKNKNGKKALAKLWSGTFKDYYYYTIQNEITMYRICNDVLKRLLPKQREAYDDMYIPELLAVVEEKNSLLMLIEFIDGKIVQELDTQKKLSIYLKTVKFIQFLGTQLTESEKEQISKRTPYHYMLLYPFLLGKAILTHPRVFMLLLAGVPVFFRSLPIFFKQYTPSLVHRDLHFKNLIFSGEKIVLIDLQLFVFTDVLYELITTLRYRWMEDDFYKQLLSAIGKNFSQRKDFMPLFMGLSVNSATHGLTGGNFPKKKIDYWINFLQFAEKPDKQLFTL